MKCKVCGKHRFFFHVIYSLKSISPVPLVVTFDSVYLIFQPHMLLHCAFISGHWARYFLTRRPPNAPRRTFGLKLGSAKSCNPRWLLPASRALTHTRARVVHISLRPASWTRLFTKSQTKNIIVSNRPQCISSMRHHRFDA